MYKRLKFPLHQLTMLCQKAGKNFNGLSFSKRQINLEISLIFATPFRKSGLYAQTYLQPHYGNGVFGQYLPFSWTTLRDKNCRRPNAVMEVVDKGLVLSI